LADLGAEVIKIERPGGGDWVRFIQPQKDGQSLLFRLLNRGKKSLTLNLKPEEGHAIFLALVKTAEVLLETFRPGVMERLGLGAAALAEANPLLVHCSMTGYGTQGPYIGRAGHDLNYVGLTGMLDLARRPGEKPSIPGAQIADITGGLWAVIGILAALLDRQGADRGTRVETSLFGAAMACLPVALARHMGEQADGIQENLLTGGVVCYQIYGCKEGGYVTLAALEPDFWSAFCQAVGRQDLLEAQFAPAVAGGQTYEELCALFLQRSRMEWAEVLKDVDCCCEPVYSLAEALDSAPVQALGMVRQDGMFPPIRLDGGLPGIPEAGSAEATLAAPGLGQHTNEILAELGMTGEQVEDLRRRGVI
jgi:crotonobetainyl-CoA:carnitine CoA-transferase CaiB-like acyl-CoA transferase